MTKKTKTKNPEYAIAAAELDRASKQVKTIAKKKVDATKARYVDLEREIAKLDSKREGLDATIDRWNGLLDSAIVVAESAKDKAESTPQYLED